MPKVLRILNRFNLGGPIHNASILTHYLAPEFETLLAGGMKEESEGDGTFILQQHDIAPTRIPEMCRSINPVKDIIAYKKICRIIQSFKPDIVHTHAAKAGFLGRLAAIRNKVPIIVHTYHGHVFHSYFSPAKSLLFKTIERQLARNTTQLIALSPCQLQELAVTHAIAPKEKFTVIPLGLELDKFSANREQHRTEFRQRLILAEDDIAIGIIGRLTRVKNHRLFIDSIRTVKDRTQSNIRGVIVGDGELREELQQYCLASNLTYSLIGDKPTKGRPDIIFTSWLKDMEKVYPGLDIVALTSHNEGTPVTLIEAQAAGIPVVATNAGGTGSVFIESQTGLLAGNNDKDDFTSKLLRLVDNGNLRKQMQQDGPIHVNRAFTHIRLAADTQELYKKLIAGS